MRNYVVPMVVACALAAAVVIKHSSRAQVLRFRDRAALDACFPHPDHQRVVQKLINPIRADAVVVDFEF